MASAQQQVQQQQQQQSKQDGNDNSNNKLLNGPCSEPYELLQQCQEKKKIIKASNAMTICVSETDLLIRCIKKNPLFSALQSNSKMNTLLTNHTKKLLQTM